jgi:DNA-binding MarR family transcriptional regulator
VFGLLAAIVGAVIGAFRPRAQQAVQQLLDGLEAEGIIRREADPEDGRGKRVVYTAKGLAAQRDARRIKRKIERDFRSRLGERAFAELQNSLRKVAAE